MPTPKNLRGYQMRLREASLPKPSHPEMLALIRERLRGLEARQEYRRERRRRIRLREREKEKARERQQVEFWEKQVE